MNFPKDLKYSKTHEWLKIENDSATIGITSYAQDQLGDIVFIELPEAGKIFNKEDEFGSIESVKSVSELIIPVSGEVLEINEKVKEDPEIINSDPYEKGWMIKVKLSNSDELNDLLSAEEYEKFVNEEG